MFGWFSATEVLPTGALVRRMHLGLSRTPLRPLFGSAEPITCCRSRRICGPTVDARSESAPSAVRRLFRAVCFGAAPAGVFVAAPPATAGRRRSHRADKRFWAAGRVRAGTERWGLVTLEAGSACRFLRNDRRLRPVGLERAGTDKLWGFSFGVEAAGGAPTPLS